MPPPLSDQVREEIAECLIKCEDTRFIHQATTVLINQINRMQRNWERSRKVTPPKHIDQGRPALLSKEIVDDLFIFFYLKDQLLTWMR